MSEGTVHIVDDDRVVRDSLKLLMHSAGLQTREYASGRDFIGHYAPAKPECLLLDLRMPDMNGLVLQRELEARDTRLPILFLSGRGDVPTAVQTLREGALDFLEKPFDNERLLDKIREAIRVDAERERTWIDQQNAEQRLAALTRRERQVVDLLVEGKINKIIAAELNLSIRTVESHRARAMKKLEADSLSEVFKLVLAARAGGDAAGP